MTPEDYLDRVRSLLPVLRERASYAEKLRRLPDETFKDFQDAGLFRCLQPKRYGGYELDPEIFYQAIIEVGTVCGSRAAFACAAAGRSPASAISASGQCSVPSCRGPRTARRRMRGCFWCRDATTLSTTIGM